MTGALLDQGSANHGDKSSPAACFFKYAFYWNTNVLNKDLLEHKLLLIPLGIVNSSLICITYGCLGFWGLIWF